MVSPKLLRTVGGSRTRWSALIVGVAGGVVGLGGFEALEGEAGCVEEFVESIDREGEVVRVGLWCELALVEDGSQEGRSGGEFGEHRCDEVAGRRGRCFGEAVDLLGRRDGGVWDEARDRGGRGLVWVRAECDAGCAFEESEAGRCGQDLAGVAALLEVQCDWPGVGCLEGVMSDAQVECEGFRGFDGVAGVGQEIEQAIGHGRGVIDGSERGGGFGDGVACSGARDPSLGGGEGVSFGEGKDVSLERDDVGDGVGGCSS